MTDHVVDFHEPTHTYGIDGVPVISVTEALKMTGCVDTQWFNEWGRHRGSTVHRAIELLERGTLDFNYIDPRIQPYMDAYERFKFETGYECLETERIVYSVKHRYAGTLDQIGQIKGQLILPDFKTGKVYPGTGLQLTGYADAYHEETGHMVSRIMGVQLKIDGLYKIEPFIANFNVWRGVILAAWWQRENL